MATKSKSNPRTKAQIAAHLRVIHNAEGEFEKWRNDELRTFHDRVHGIHSRACVDTDGKVECVCTLAVAQ